MRSSRGGRETMFSPFLEIVVSQTCRVSIQSRSPVRSSTPFATIMRHEMILSGTMAQYSIDSFEAGGCRIPMRPILSKK